jgi:hypothetical protein
MNMKLVKRLGSREVKDYRVSYAAFKCDECDEVVERTLSSGISALSCGCAQRESQAKSVLKHGDAKKGQVTRLYARWISMRQLCQNEKKKGYPTHGARGIKVCKKWDNSFPEFKAWAEENDYSDDKRMIRKDKDKNFEPRNCVWVDGCKKVIRVYNPKMTKEKALAIRHLHGRGSWSQPKLSELFAVPLSSVNRIVKDEAWLPAS